MDQAQLLRHLVETLEAIGIEYMIGGSQASIYYGEPRFTQDIAIVAIIRPSDIKLLIEKFPLPEFYLSEEAIHHALQHRAQFHIIHPTSGLKIDVILLKDTPYDREQFRRRQRLPLLPGTDAYFALPEDVIIYKLLYFREGRSDKHLRDIAGILAISGGQIDHAYIAQWVAQLGLDNEWSRVTTAFQKKKWLSLQSNQQGLPSGGGATGWGGLLSRL